tara:strand:+ start:480 stop:1604 length:1125 start_codon:yes stop_codon:yes gene_type:complete
MINIKVAIVQRCVTDYRVDFYKKLQKILLKNSIDLSVFSGDVPPNEAYVDGLNKLPFGKRIDNYYYLNNQVYWQNLFCVLTRFDLVIVEQANYALLNYPLLLNRYIFRSKPLFAFWGHGATLHKEANKYSKWLKRFFVSKADFWFGYTEHTRMLLHDHKVPDNKIMIVNNSLDAKEIVSARAKLNKIKDIKIVGNKNFNVIFCARLNQSKAIPFIIDSCRIAFEQISQLKLTIIGEGPLKKYIRKKMNDNPWIEMKGPLFGKEKANALIKGDLMVLPSHVGLSIIDGFAAGLPVLVSDFKNHCPEIAYFEEDVNGLMTLPSKEAYAEAIVKLYKNPKLLNSMSCSAIKTSEKFTVENMAMNFSIGIIKALEYRN